MRHAIAAAIALAVAASAHAEPLDGRTLAERFECGRCHDGLEVDPVPRDQHCVHCHQVIIDGDDHSAPAQVVARWSRHLVSLREVPSLAKVGALLRRDWVRAFLLAPHDLRPSLRATMPRLALGEAEAEALARWLVPDEDGASAAGVTADDVAAGEVLYRSRRCGTCHAFGGATVDENPGRRWRREPPPPAIALAPDLRHARARLRAGTIERLLVDPRALRPDALMPAYALSPVEARQLAAFLVAVPLASSPPPPPEKRLPLLRRPVHFAEVSARVFRNVCWHCHAAPGASDDLGDAGPGNDGGFGFPPRGLDLSSATGMALGALDDGGRRHSIFVARPDGTPTLVARLLARRREEAGQFNPSLRGMPLGLPALSLEDIQLVDTWIAQGRPR